MKTSEPSGARSGSALLLITALITAALNTIFAFITLGLALMVLARRAGGLLGRSPADGSRTASAFVLIFVMLAAGIVATGYIYFRHYEKAYRVEVARQLSAIADLKVDELARWRQERMADGGIFFKNPTFSALVRRFLAQPADADAQRQLQDWAGSVSKSHGYDQLRLLDAQGVTRLSIPGGLMPASSTTVQAAAEALRSGQILLQDFYRHERDHRVYLQVMVPILDDLDASRPLGVVGLRVDPAIYLYPFLKRWPTLSKTAETLLLRRDGNDVLYLNDLRHQPNAALALRLPLTRTDVPAVRVALGQTGIMRGVDYRGVPVITVGRAVPDSPWFMIAKMDVAEVNAPLREHLWQMVSLIGALLLGAGGGVGLVWRQRRVRFYRDKAAAAEKLRLSESQYRELFESSSDPLLLIASDTGQVIDANNMASEIYGYGRDELLTKKSTDLSAEPEETSRRIREVQSKPGQVVHVPLRLHRKKDGTVFPVEITARSLIREGQSVILVSCRDITERKQAEEALRQQAAELHELNETKNRFIGMAAHDLRNPVGVIMGYSELVLEEAGDRLGGEQRDFLRGSLAAAEGMKRLIDNFLDISVIESGQLRLERSQTDVAEILAGTLPLVRLGAARKKVELITESGADERPLAVDVAKLQQVLANLLSNAIEHSQAGQRVWLGVRRDDTELVFSVRDEGSGIALEDQTRLFVPFVRAGTRKTAGERSVGLGLAIARMVVEAHGGRIWVESIPGHGAAFFFALPVQTQHQTAEPTHP